MHITRFRLAALVAGTTFVAAGAAATWSVDAAPGDDDATLVPIVPCRLADTRDAPDRVGDTDTLGADATVTLAAHGTNGNCTIPADAVGLSMNVTAVDASSPTFITIWGDGDRPVVSSLNPTPGQPPTPNAVTSELSPAGTLNVFNLAGDVDLIVDVNGFYTSASLTELDAELDGLGSAVGGLADDVAGLDTDVTELAATVDELNTGATNRPFNIRLGHGESEVIATNGPISLVAGCTLDTAPDPDHSRAVIYAVTTEDDDVVMDSDEDSADGNPDFLLPGRAIEDSEMFVKDDNFDTTEVEVYIDGGFILTASGEYLAIDGETLALGVAYAGSNCTMAGTVTSFTLAP